VERERKEGEGKENDMKHEMENRCREKEEEREFGRGRISCSDGGGNLVVRGGGGLHAGIKLFLPPGESVWVEGGQRERVGEG
jgi:hypothetical protein